LVKILNINRFEVSVDVDDDGNGNGSLRGSNGNHNQTEKMALQLIGIKKPVENHKINIDRIENQLNGHQHRNQISSGQETIDADKEHQGTDDQK
jgi:hypothetical protein